MNKNTLLHMLLSVIVFAVIFMLVLPGFQSEEPIIATDLETHGYASVSRELQVLNENFFGSETPIEATTDQEADSDSLDEGSTDSMTELFATTATRYVNIDGLNMREGPGTHHAVLDVLALNQPVEVSTTATNGAWVAIKFGDKLGYVNDAYLNKQAVVKQAEPSATAKSETTTEKKSSTPDPNVEKKATEQPDPPAVKNKAQALTTVTNNQQLILVTNKQASQVNVTVETFERDANGDWQPVFSTNGYIGKSGFSFNKKEGDGASPAGKFSIGTAFGSKGNPGTALPFRGITDDDVWVDDPESSLYNSWQSKKKSSDQYTSAENMNIPLYRYGFVINYNTNRTPYRGSAIFFHIGNSYTLGCTAVSEANVIRLIKWLNPNKNPTIIQTPESGLRNF